MLKCELCERILPDPGGNPADVDCQNCHQGQVIRIKDAQLVCEKGHQINEAYFSNEDDNKIHCPQCGSKTLFKCLNCQWEIPGNTLTEGSQPITEENPEVPDYCEHCGNPFPWTIYNQSSVSKILEPYPPIGIKITRNSSNAKKPRNFTRDKTTGLNVGHHVALWILFFLLLFLAISYAQDSNWPITALWGTPATGLFVALVTRRL